MSRKEIDRLELCLFFSRVLFKNKSSLQTADHAQKFKNNGTIFIIMTSSFMTMTNNWTPTRHSAIAVDTLDLF